MGSKHSKNKKNKSIHKITKYNNKKNSKHKTQSIKKTITFNYKGEQKVISFYNKFYEESIKNILKIYFSIEESIEQIFFQDNEDDILILNSNIPNNISVNLFVRKDFIPKNLVTVNISNNIKNEKSLLKFHWVLENEEKNEKFKRCIKNKYIYVNISGDDVHPSVNSSISFTKGMHFFIIRVGTFQCYERLAIINDDIKNYYKNYKTFIGFHYMEGISKYGEALDIAIFIDMDRKKCKFYDYEKKKILTQGKIESDSVILNGWLKCGIYSEERGMTILNEGCIPIPNWVLSKN